MIRRYLLLPLMIVMCLTTIYSCKPLTCEPEIIIETIEVPVEVIKVEKEYIDRTITVPVVEVEWVSPELRHFDNLTELKEWLVQDTVDKMLLSGYDCDDFAYKLQQHGARDGYYISTELVMKGRKPHMINSVLIEGEIYFIEPQDDEVWWKYHQD